MAINTTTDQDRVIAAVAPSVPDLIAIINSLDGQLSAALVTIANLEVELESLESEMKGDDE